MARDTVNHVSTALVPVGEVRVVCTQRQQGVECQVETALLLSTFEDAQLDKLFDVLLCLTEATNGIPGYALKKQLPDADKERRKGAAIAKYKRTSIEE